MKQPQDKAPLKFPGVDAAQAVDLSQHALRIKGLVRKAVDVAKGEDAMWDAWAIRHVAIKGGLLNGVAGLSLATESYLRGLQNGLKAHIPIADDEEFKQKRLLFRGLIARAAIRFAAVEMVAKSSLGDATPQTEKDVLEAIKMAEDGFKTLAELENNESKLPEHPLVKAQRIMGARIADLRVTKNRPELSEQDRQGADVVFDILQKLYREMFGAPFPG